MFSLKVLAFGLVVGLSVVRGDEELQSIREAQNRKLDFFMDSLQGDYEANTKGRFLALKQMAQDMAKSSGEQKSKEFLDAAQLATLVQSLRYAVLRKTILATKDIINRRFVEQGQGFLDTRTGIVVLPQLVPVVVSRAILRAYADGSRFVDSTWNWFHLVVEHHHEKSPEIRQVAVEAYKQRGKFLGESQSALAEYKSTLAAALAEIGIHKDNSASIELVLDRIINESMGCPQCPSNRPGDGDNYLGVGPMFADDSAVNAALQENVDVGLQNAFVDIDGVYTPGHDVKAQVTPAQIDTLMRKLLA